MGPLTFPVTVTANGVTHVYGQVPSGGEAKPQTIPRVKFIRK
jgi:hypothetical protein